MGGCDCILESASPSRALGLAMNWTHAHASAQLTVARTTTWTR